MSTSFAAQTDTLLAELRTTRRRNLPFMALGVIAAFVALGIMVALVIQNWQQAEQIQSQALLLEQQKLFAQQEIKALNQTLLQIERRPDETRRLVSNAIKQASAADVALSETKALVPESADLSAIKPPPETVTLGLQTVAPGSKEGWDVDLFWCAGHNQVANYASARLASIRLGIEAARGRTIADGLSLGRIRLRPVRAQDRSAWPAGFYAVADSGPGEVAAADAVASFLTGKELAATRKISRGKPTAYYLSVFACN